MSAPPPSLGAAALRSLAARHGIRPDKSLGQNFLIDPNLARRIVEHAEVEAGDHVVEVGAGLGSLTVALAAAGADVLAVEFDRGVVEALREVVGGLPRVTVLHADALRVDWAAKLPGGPWKMVSNLPYNVGVPIVLEQLERAPQIRDFVIMVQREVGERLTAWPNDKAYGAVSVRVTYRVDAAMLRRVPATVFWPRPAVDSVLVRLTRLERPRVPTDPDLLFRVVDEGFAQRRKTMRNALVRLGAADPEALLRESGLEPKVRAENLGLEEFARLAEGLAGG